jgi:SAM-dependent methyltransferase
VTWSDLDWPRLDHLRERFLGGSAAGGPYWESRGDLASYDLTYGERIGWKWDQVLRELRMRAWQPAARTRAVLDWGCGSGIAARRVIAFFGTELFDSLAVCDHSPLAAEFAADAARRSFPSLRVTEATPRSLADDSPIGLLIVSHVLNELDAAALASLRALVARADAVIWVEPGTHAVSRRLGRLRDELRDGHRLVAPCTHAQSCPMFAEGNERHWCHFFAPPPPGVLADSDWVKFGRRAGIDLRSLPYAFFALERAQAGEPFDRAPDSALSRVIGRVEHAKPHARLWSCDASGLAELSLRKRADPALFKELERTKAPLVYRWLREGDRILGGETA